jgi:hypothetical protein
MDSFPSNINSIIGIIDDMSSVNGAADSTLATDSWNLQLGFTRNIIDHNHTICVIYYT